MNYKFVFIVSTGILLLTACSSLSHRDSNSESFISLREIQLLPHNQASQINISDESAKQIALDQINGTMIEFSKDFDDAIPNYDITIVKDDYKYEFEVSAIDGSILAQSTEQIQTASSSLQVNITSEQAKQIALTQINGTMTEFDYDLEEAVPTYEITIVSGEIEYDFKINAIDGSIISQSEESIYH